MKSDPVYKLYVKNPVTSYEEAKIILSKQRVKMLEYKNGKYRGIPAKGAASPDDDKEKGRRFYITNTSIDEMLSGKHVTRSADIVSHYTAAANVAELWKNSSLLRTYPDKYAPEGKSNIKLMHKRTALMQIGEKSYIVEMTAKEYDNENNDNILYQVKTKNAHPAY